VPGFSRDTTSSSEKTLPDIAYDWVDTNDGARKFVSNSLGAGTYFLDTEFHREKTYFPQLALVQICVGDSITLIDPTTIDPEILKPLLEGPDLCVLHAAQQDLDVLSQTVGAVPSRILDTQILAGFLGHSQPSLASLLQIFLKISLPKGDRLTDWLRRPLTRDQLSYAASDVAHLPALLDIMVTRLTDNGRLAWAEEACEELRLRRTGPQAPEDAWLRVKDIRTVKGKSRWVARSVAMWRERRAMDLDIPPRHVLSDIAVLGIAQRSPRTPEELLQCRGVDNRHVNGAQGKALMNAIRDGVDDSKTGDLSFPSSDTEDLDKSLRPAATLVSAWITELARQSDLDVSLLGTRRDINDLLSGSAQARLRHGWRAEIVGRDIEDLVAGRKALTFVHRGDDNGLRMVDVPTE
jgi:ribonuclease D